MLLQLATWPDIEAYLTRSSSILIPIGSTEQHGPNGYIGTDAICPETIANAVEQETDILIAPTISIGMAQHHLAFPGTISLRPGTLMAIISDVVDSLAGHGFDHFYFLNGHGGNVATLHAAFAECHAKNSFANTHRASLIFKLQSWWMGKRVQSLSNELFDNAEGSHATPSEVSLSYFAYPEQAKTGIVMQPERAPSGEIGDAIQFRKQFPDGRIGSNPGLASIEAGGKLLQAATADTLESLTAFKRS